MTNPTIEIFDAVSGENISREMTDIEWQKRQEEIALNEQIAAERTAKKEADEAKRQAILDRLGLTEEEAKLLLG